MVEPRPRLGVSSCLLGEQVRYDGRHKRAPFLTDVLAPHVTWEPVCPEVEVGMGVPREPVELGPEGSLRGRESGREWGPRLRAWSAERLQGLPALDGYLLKARSPSCGLEGPGLWARALGTARPSLPRLEAERLVDDLEARDAFLTAAFLSARLRAAAEPEQAQALHDRLGLLLECSPGAGERAAALLAEGRLPAWRAQVLAAVQAPDRGWQRELLVRLLEQARPQLDPARAAALAGAVSGFAAGEAPLERARTLLRAWARQHDPQGLLRELWLEPYPRTLALLRLG